MASPTRRWLREQRAFVAVALGVAAGFVYLIFQPDHWRRGTGVIAVALLVAAGLRLFLPDLDAGLLVVRRRWFDALVYLVLGSCILAVDIRVQG